MKKLRPDATANVLSGSVIEFYKGKSSKFWDGMLIGLLIGYIPFLWHMYV